MTAGNARGALERRPRRDILPEGHDPHAVGPVAAAEALSAQWGSVFKIGYDGRWWQAERHDGTGTVICALTPDDLAVRMKAALEGSPW